MHMEESATRPGSTKRSSRIPLDGKCRLLYDVWQPLMLLTLTACFMYFFYTGYNPSASKNPDDLFFCTADGSVEKAAQVYSLLWDPQLYFTINIGFGEFAFSVVKIIDAVWDTVVGRGGQMVAGLVAYRVLRRSLTLTMEKSTVTIPTVTTLYCQKVQLVSVGQLFYDIIWHWGPKHGEQRRLNLSAKLRLGMQIFVCIYVLSFATLVSVMTGYRAQLTGYFGYETQHEGQLQPISRISVPRLAVYDGKRVGLSDSPIYSREGLFFPTQKQTDSGPAYDIGEFIDGTANMTEPDGLFVDYYFTCLGLFEWVRFEHDLDKNPSNTTSYSLSCAKHKCSCSISDLEPGERRASHRIFASIKSSIEIDGKPLELGAPPLKIGLATYTDSDSDSISSMHKFSRKSNFDNASDFWRGGVGHISSPSALSSFKLADSSIVPHVVYWSGGAVVLEDTVKKTGTCISDKAYAWGFSSLILLTFCSYTLVFAMALSLLQTDVYWNSRYDRKHQTHSIYTDVLYLAEELKATFGHSVEDHLQAPSKFSKQVERWKQGLQLPADGLNVSRWEERQRLRARDAAILAADRKKTGSDYRYDEVLPDELRSFQIMNIHPTSEPSQERFNYQSPPPQPTASAMAKYAHQRRSESRPEPRFEPIPSSEQSLVLEEYELSLRTTSGSAGASVSEEQGLIANAAPSGTRKSTDEVEEVPKY